MAWQLYEWAKDQNVRPAARKLILMLVADHADAGSRECHPSQSYLAVESGLSERQVHSHLKALAEEDGLIEIEERKGVRGTFGYNVYRLRASAADLAAYFDESRMYLAWRAKRAGERTNEVQRRPETNGSPLPTAEAATNGSTASSPTEVWRPGQRKPTSVKPKRQTKSETTKEDAASAALITLPAYAGSKESDDADASSAAATAAAREDARSAKPKRPKPPTLDQRLDAHLAALGPDVIDEMYRDLDNDRTGITMWAVKKARRTLGLGWVEPEDDPGGPLARKAVGLVLMRLTKADGGGLTPTVEDLLGDFEWPDERAPSEYQSAKPSEPRPSPGFYVPGAGDEAATAALRNVHRAIADMDCLELGAAIEQFQSHRPRIYRECRAAAAEAIPAADAEAVDRETLCNGADYYLTEHRKWPAFLIPESIRPAKAAA